MDLSRTVGGPSVKGTFMKKFLSILLIFCFLLSFTSCSRIKNFINPEPSTEAPTAATVRVMIKPGWSVVQIAEALEENGVCTADSFIEACKTIPEGYEELFAGNENVKADSILFPVEGYLMPETLEYYQGKDGEYALTRMLDFTKKTIDSLTIDGKTAYALAEERGLTMYELFTLASVVQYEANFASNDVNFEILQKVASVFYNRLNNTSNFGYLESDATRAYITKKNSDYLEEIGITKDSTEYENLLKGYETYRRGTKGLPVGPVCNPSLSVIKATLSPADTDYYYFFTYDKDGSTEFYFSKTYSEHNSQYKKLS